MLQYCGQSYDTSVSQLIVSEAVVGYNQTQTHHNKTNFKFLLPWQPHWYPITSPYVSLVQGEHSQWFSCILFKTLTFPSDRTWVCHIISTQKPHIPVATVTDKSWCWYNLIKLKEIAQNLQSYFFQDYGRSRRYCIMGVWLHIK